MKNLKAKMTVGLFALVSTAKAYLVIGVLVTAVLICGSLYYLQTHVTAKNVPGPLPANTPQVYATVDEYVGTETNDLTSDAGCWFVAAEIAGGFFAQPYYMPHAIHNPTINDGLVGDGSGDQAGPTNRWFTIQYWIDSPVGGGTNGGIHLWLSLGPDVHANDIRNVITANTEDELAFNLTINNATLSFDITNVTTPETADFYCYNPDYNLVSYTNDVYGSTGGLSGGKVSMTVTPTFNVVILSSTNMVVWTAATNNPAVTPGMNQNFFTDTNWSKGTFYRAMIP